MQSSDLPTRRFGSFSDSPTVIGLGGAVLNHTSYSQGVETVKRALELGITYFDTSPGYCNNLSQPIMGEGLADAGDEIMLATKIGYFKRPSDFRSKEAINAQIKDNLRLLGRRRVDVLQIHEANWVAWWEDKPESATADFQLNGAYDFENAPALEALREAKKNGICRYIGITGNKAELMCRALRSVSVDTFLLAFSYDPVIRYAENEAFSLAGEKNVVLILGAIFYGGRLTAVHPEWLDNQPDWMTPEFHRSFSQLYDIQRETGISLVQLSVRFVLSKEQPAVILIGASTPGEIEESVNAVNDGPLPEDIYDEIARIGVGGPA